MIKSKTHPPANVYTLGSNKIAEDETIPFFKDITDIDT